MSNIDKQALREAAKKATPGDWRRASTRFNGITSQAVYPLCGKEEILANTAEKRDAEFIAAANPTTVLALLDELEDKDQRFAELELRLSQQQSIAANNLDMFRRADARVSELEAREVKMPELKMLRDYLAEVTHREREDILLGVKLEFHRELQAAGIITKVGE